MYIYLLARILILKSYRGEKYYVRFSQLKGKYKPDNGTSKKVSNKLKNVYQVLIYSIILW